MLTRQHSPVSEAEYLRLEMDNSVRHEYVNGEMFAMTGGTLRHNVIAGNIFAALRAHLRPTPCRAFMADVRIRAEKHNAYYYPDVVVSCGSDARALDPKTYTASDPLLVVEVLSDSTEAIDRREKLLAYRTLASLQEYAVVAQDEARVVIHRRRGDIGWDVVEYSGPETVEFASVDLRLPMDEIYDGVPIEALERRPG